MRNFSWVQKRGISHSKSQSLASEDGKEVSSINSSKGTPDNREEDY